MYFQEFIGNLGHELKVENFSSRDLKLLQKRGNFIDSVTHKGKSTNVILRDKLSFKKSFKKLEIKAGKDDVEYEGEKITEVINHLMFLLVLNSEIY